MPAIPVFRPPWHWERVICAFLMMAMLCCLPHARAAELQLDPVRIAPGVYVVYGSEDAASYDNDALNVNLGFVVTSAGIVVIDSGPSYRVAQTLHRAIQRISNYPIKYVVNTGAEPQRWLGNSYFSKLGVPLLAHQEARKLMEAHGAQQLKAMQALLEEKAAGTELALPRGLRNDTEEIRFSDSVLQLLYFGPAREPGNIAVWLPRQEIAYSGAIMYGGLVPELGPDSRIGNWIAAFDGVAALRPRQVVPGRGKVGDITAMSADTRAYLTALHGHASPRVQGDPLAPFKRLKNYGAFGASNLDYAAREKAAQP